MFVNLFVATLATLATLSKNAILRLCNQEKSVANACYTFATLCYT
jgi:hypothetical protein